MEGVARGIDIFDCVLPTRVACNGQALLRMESSTCATPVSPRILRRSTRPAIAIPCRHFSRAYIRHLFVAKEMLGATLLTIHNLHNYYR